MTSKFVSELVLNDYDVIRQIGEGEFAIVYEIVHKKTNKHYALKCFKVSSKSIKRNGIESSILREIVLLQKLKSVAGCVQLIEIFPPTNVVLEFYEHNLRTFIRRQQYNNFDQIKHIMLQLLNTCEQLHHQNIWHRDLKPENILMNENFDRCFIADFGLSRMAAYFRVFTHDIATIEYRAHELFFDYDAYDGTRVDVWSLGVIFVELLTRGKILWNASTEMKMLKEMYKILGTPPDFLHFQKFLFPREERLHDLSTTTNQVVYDTVELGKTFEFAKEQHFNEYHHYNFTDYKSKREKQQQYATEQFFNLFSDTILVKAEIKPKLAKLLAQMFDYDPYARISVKEILNVYGEIFV